jgi:hypothetical protein
LFKKQDVEIWIKLSWLTGGSIGMLVWTFEFHKQGISGQA